jgi:hypothetical protein
MLAQPRNLPTLLQCYYNQDTYVGHMWRLRDATSGRLLQSMRAPLQRSR